MLESPPSPLALVRIRFPGPALGPLGRTPEPTRNQARSQAGTSLAPAGFHGAGARVVPAWLRVGSGFVPGRFRVGSGFLPGGQRARVFFKGPRGPFKGPRGPFKDPGVFVKGPRGPFKGPHEFEKARKVQLSTARRRLGLLPGRRTRARCQPFGAAQRDSLRGCTLGCL